ncbi:MAG TPA: hypothetical protein VLJ39_22730 [Tepidisphaeraceae bacterium]|nr:hypothetical protein [Tepidisphaeraceae bacterium]
MRKYLMTAMLSASMVGLPMIVGCDRTLHEDQKTTAGPNGQTTTDTKTVEHPNGTVTKEQSVNHNNNNP